MPRNTFESYSFGEAPAGDWRTEYTFLDDPAERSPVEDWSPGELVQAVGSWRGSGLDDWPPAASAELWPKALGQSDYRPEARLHELAASLAGAYTHAPERVLQEYGRALETMAADGGDCSGVDQDVYRRVDSYGGRFEGVKTDDFEVEDGGSEWRLALQADLALARDDLELGRRLFYLGVVADDDWLVDGGRRFVYDAMTRLQRSVDGWAGADDHLDARSSLNGVSAHSLSDGASYRVDRLQSLARDYGPGVGAQPGLVDAFGRLASEHQAALDVGWAAESFAASVAESPVEGPVGDLLAAAGRDLFDSNLVFRLGYASALAEGREQGVLEHLGAVLDAVEWGGQAVAAVGEPSHFYQDGTASDRVEAGYGDARRSLLETLETEGDLAVLHMALTLERLISGGGSLPRLVAGYAYSRAQESRVLMSRPGWAEDPESRDSALEGYLQAGALMLLNSDVLARRQ